ncbi:uncharacterized protein [Primulina eburnea]|uniref:uncharacterized protein n=1 Tax=Primulina eburnea TaxID=1245227 RepID=UPI003C6C4C43
MSITCCREKAVLVTVYVEKPRLRSRSSENGLSSSHRHHHHIYHDISKHDKRGRGYNRRAELLEYSRQLRATSVVASNSKAPPTSEVLPAKRKPKRATSPSCLGKWDSLIPSFFKTTMNPKGKKKSSVFTTTKMEALVKCLQEQKKGTFMSKWVTRWTKHHK